MWVLVSGSGLQLLGYGSRVAGRTLVREARDRVSGLIRIEEFDFKFRFSDRTLAREARDRVFVQPHRRVCRSSCKASVFISQNVSI